MSKNKVNNSAKYLSIEEYALAAEMTVAGVKYRISKGYISTTVIKTFGQEIEVIDTTVYPIARLREKKKA